MGRRPAHCIGDRHPIRDREYSIALSVTPTPFQNNGDPLSFVWTLAGPTASSHPTQVITTTNPTLTTFTPDVAGPWSVSLVVTDTTLDRSVLVPQTGFTVDTAVPLAITGPTTISDGSATSYGVVGSATNSVTWTVTNTNTDSTSSPVTGSQFTFTPTASGQYVIDASGTDSGDHTSTASLDVTVTHLARL